MNTSASTRICRVCGKEKSCHLMKKGKGCKDGIAPLCLECHRIDSKQRREQDPEATRTYWKRYRAERAEHLAQYRHKRLPQRRANRAKNAEKYRKSARKRYQKNREKELDRSRKWHRNNPEKVRILNQRRISQKRQLLAEFNNDDWKRSLNWWYGVCAYCGKGPSLFDVKLVLHQDHFVPQSRGGHYTRDNILPACQSCNLSKRDRDPVEWIAEHFGMRESKRILKRITEYFRQVK